MKKTKSVLALITLMLGQALIAAAPSTAAATVTKTKTFGQAAIAEFVQEETCRITRIEVFATANQIKGATSEDKFAIVAVSRLNTCTNLLETDGFGQTSDFELTVNENLSSAAFKVSLPVSNLLNGTSNPLALDLQWTATTAKEKIVARDRFESEGVVFVSKAATALRQAVATGSAVLGSEVIIAPGDQSVSASIHQAKTRETTKAQARP
jgi:hypothetical protein